MTQFLFENEESGDTEMISEDRKQFETLLDLVKRAKSSEISVALSGFVDDYATKYVVGTSDAVVIEALRQQQKQDEEEPESDEEKS